MKDSNVQKKTVGQNKSSKPYPNGRPQLKKVSDSQRDFYRIGAYKPIF